MGPGRVRVRRVAGHRRAAALWAAFKAGSRNIAQAFVLRARRSRAWLRQRPRLARRLAAGTLGAIGLFAGVAAGTWTAVCRDCPSIARIYAWEPQAATQILDHDGKRIAQLFKERRTPVEIGTLPAYVPAAFVAIEDKRFYRHRGFDIIRLVGANLKNVLSGRITGGGSTITQQLARWMFEDEIGFEQVLTRKLKELKVALELERVYPKEQILEAYINQVNYGDGRYGIESAAQYFFGKQAIELDPAEAALLAAVINRPSTYSPFRHPDRARTRRNIVLRLMAEQGYLTEAEAEESKLAPLPETPHRNDEGQLAPYFVEWVRDQLDDRFGADLYSKGLQVTTTLDLEMQRMAQMAMDSGWARIERQSSFDHPQYSEIMEQGGSEGASETKYLQGMFIAVSPDNGDVRALIGGRDFEDSKFNRAIMALRQPGSTFKPFTYTAALASGIPASHVIYDAPVMIPLHDGTIYSPKNYDPDFRGPLTLRDALKFSINTVAVRLGQEVGLETIVQTAKQMGIQTEVLPFASMPIGAFSVIPIQLVEAYTAFANTGVKVTPRSILKVEDQDGRLLWETTPHREQVVDSAVAAIMRSMLTTALNNGSGNPARTQPYGLPYEVPAGGKTGTTNDGTDMWFVGFTPDLVAALWFGFDRPQKIVNNAAGGVYAAPVWGRFMRQVYYPAGDTGSAELPVPTPWAWPAGITTRNVDRETGLLASTWCGADDMYTEYFVPGTEPTAVCEPRGGLFTSPLRQLRRDTMFDGPPDTTRAIDRRRRW
ncbi:MAG: penicillin-binding protein 1A [Longimicrobiales bacterium]